VFIFERFLCGAVAAVVSRGIIGGLRDWNTAGLVKRWTKIVNSWFTACTAPFAGIFRPLICRGMIGLKVWPQIRMLLDPSTQPTAFDGILR
jgi:hypothetical protein